MSTTKLTYMIHPFQIGWWKAALNFNFNLYFFVVLFRNYPGFTSHVHLIGTFVDLLLWTYFCGHYAFSHGPWKSPSIFSQSIIKLGQSKTMVLVIYFRSFSPLAGKIGKNFAQYHMTVLVPYINSALKTLFNTVEDRFFLYFDVCVVSWCSDGSLDSQECESFDNDAVTIRNL